VVEPPGPARADAWEDVPVRLRLDLAYDGGAFHGWAAQPGLRTVQGELERALAMVLRVGSVPVTCAGRTDTGVHARGQVVHLDVDEPVLLASAGRSTDPPAEALARRLNGVLEDDLRIRAARPVPDQFDARFGALWRRYVYRLVDRPDAVDPLARNHVVTWGRALDEAAMDVAAGRLVGEHDFAAYCKQREGATTVRELLELRWTRDSAGVLLGTVRADAFCHSMVRSLVGALVAVGEGRRTVDWPGEVLSRRVRDPRVLVMPAHGLTLEEVAYPGDDELAHRAATTRKVRTLG
jgi:tRNA pseudouridine38-40 synthase